MWVPPPGHRDESWKLVANEAMDRYAAGDDAAFSELYDALSPRLLVFLQRRTRDDELAADLLQQTFLQMHCARRHFTPRAEVLPWAFAIARRLIIDRVRKARHEPARASEPSLPRERRATTAAPRRLRAPMQVRMPPSSARRLPGASTVSSLACRKPSAKPSSS